MTNSLSGSSEHSYSSEHSFGSDSSFPSDFSFSDLPRDLLLSDVSLSSAPSAEEFANSIPIVIPNPNEVLHDLEDADKIDWKKGVINALAFLAGGALVEIS